MSVQKIAEESIQVVVCLSCFTMVIAVWWQFAGAGSWFH